ncbi:hypothetical protein GCM10009740_31280 [Terrabacter terrae]|uniref:Uncharacterized protein n=1 Tax=Terrabacter terrae TaxID=318434 RepID=A0ABP5G242_9MICO
MTYRVGLRRHAGVDPRHPLQRQAFRILATAYLGIAGCALLGAGLAAAAVVHLTTPPAPKETPC